MAGLAKSNGGKIYVVHKDRLVKNNIPSAEFLKSCRKAGKLFGEDHHNRLLK